MAECPLTKNMVKYLELMSSQAWWPLKGKDEPIGIECPTPSLSDAIKEGNARGVAHVAASKVDCKSSKAGGSYCKIPKLAESVREDLKAAVDTMKTDMDPGQAVKHDQGKSRMDLIPPEAIEGIAEVLTFGANKYTARNWEQGSDWGRFTAALLRHFTAWMSGEDYDPETGLNHLKHVLCNAAFLLTFQERGIGYDDRGTTDQRKNIGQPVLQQDEMNHPLFGIMGEAYDRMEGCGAHPDDILNDSSGWTDEFYTAALRKRLPEVGIDIFRQEYCSRPHIKELVLREAEQK